MKEIFIIFFGSTVAAFIFLMLTKTDINWRDITEKENFITENRK